ncbi:MAG TPA: carboxypeptidase-like regulatory domain-containing protein [Candidatus Thermoplasmatota archaeon]|nr:carboxypeptidase-like regulatory domain-containing protein [Candidatus Thermoplasmatota archaeon]
MARGHLLLALFGAFLIAGCGSGGDTPGDGDGDGPEVDATATTGGIRGVVVDDAIRPIAGASVVVLGTGKNATTDEAGLFTVSGLLAASYVVEASHPLYGATQQSVEVRAGVRDPPAVKFQLTRTILEDPYMQVTKFDGFIVCSVGGSVFASEECGEGVGVPCDVPVPPGCERVGGQGNNVVQYDFFVDGPFVRTLVIEQVWNPNSEATGSFYTVAPATNWTCDPACGGNLLGDMAGPSPLLSRLEVANGTVIPNELNLQPGGTTRDEVAVTADTKFSTFTWPQWGACDGLTGPTSDPACTTQANYAANQPFQLFVTAFYYLPAPEGWSFVAGDQNPF